MAGRQYHRVAAWATALLPAWLCWSDVAYSQATIMLRQGGAISVTAPAAFDRLAFDAAGQIWWQRPDQASATPITTTGDANRRPAFSPDGRRIAFEAQHAGRHQIFVHDLDSGATRQVTFGAWDHLTPAWRPSPDGARLVVSSNRGGSFDIWEVAIDDLKLRQLTFTTGDEHDPAWNEDGTKLAYVTPTTTGSSLFTLVPGAPPERVLQEPGQIRAPSWRPGGGVLLYVREHVETSQLRMLLLSRPPVTKPITHHEQVVPRPAHWLTAGEFLYTADNSIRRRQFGVPAFTEIPFTVTLRLDESVRTARTPAPRDRLTRAVRGHAGRTERGDGRQVAAALGDLWELQRNGSALTLIRQLTNDAYVDAQPVFSPDGQQLAFVSDRGGSLQVWIMQHASAAMRPLSGNDAVVGHPTWTADGSAVVYIIGAERGGYRLRLADVASGQAADLPVTAHRPGRPAHVAGAWVIASTARVDPEADFGAPPGVVADTGQPLPLIWRPAGRGARTVVRAGRVFDGIGPGYLTRQDIVIEDGVVVAVQPWSDAETPHIDAEAYTVIPGLTDLTVAAPPEAAKRLALALEENINRYEQRHGTITVAAPPVSTERLGRQWLAAGVTTIRQTVDDWYGAIEQLESWHSARRIGPRLTLAVRPCDRRTGSLDAALFDRMLAEAEALNIVAVELCRGLDAHTLTDVIDRAHRNDLAVIATTALRDLTLGVDEVRPMAPGTKDATPGPSGTWSDVLVVAGAAGIGVPSRIAAGPAHDDVIANLLTGWQFRRIFTAAEQQTWRVSWPRAQAGGRAPFPDPNRFLGAGGRIILGSGAPRTPPGLGLHAQMQTLAAGSIQPFQILKMAGPDAARVLGNGAIQGILQPGRAADLVVIDGDPLTDIGAATAVIGTMVDGRYYERSDLINAGRRGPTGAISGAGVEKLYNSIPPQPAFVGNRDGNADRPKAFPRLPSRSGPAQTGENR